MKKTSFLKVLVLVPLLLFAATAVFGADLLVPKMELITRGYIENSSFTLATRGNFDLAVAGGYKFGGRLVFTTESDHLEDITDEGTIQFKAASVTLRDIFTLPLDISYFVGSIETLWSGDIFPERYGTKQIATKYRGYTYFPESIQYDGISDIYGTGMKFDASFSDRFGAAAYLYQDSYLGDGKYSADIRTLLNLELLKLEAFIGSSFPMSSFGYYRFGLFLFVETGSGGEFLTQIGIPKYDPYTDPFNINLFYFLFEPRVRINIFSIILTLFWHPGYYQFEETNEIGSVDMNINFFVGDPEKYPVSGGLESSLKFSTTSTEQFQAIISPYFSAVTSGVLWDIKINTKVFPFNIEDLFEIFIGIKAEF